VGVGLGVGLGVRAGVIYLQRLLILPKLLIQFSIWTDFDYLCYMIKRTLNHKIKEMARKFPVVSITGPRQSGKTTLVRHVFKDYHYVSLEDPDARLYAQSDPRGFLSNHPEGLIIDEVQRVPELFSYIQTITDESNKTGQFILTGSQNFLLLEKISQSLAGRVAVLKLLPLSLEEMTKSKMLPTESDKILFKGFYPRLYDKDIAPEDYYPNYIQTYLERDVRQIKNITDLNVFTRFLKLCAGRTGQLVNLSAI
jgi:predicted AAA+ superfamily ATPase